MRHYVIDPENADRIIKVPLDVRQAIIEEALVDLEKRVAESYHVGYSIGVEEWKISHNQHCQSSYDQGYEDAKQYYTNDCFFCGPMGDWSTTACNACLAQEENQWFLEKDVEWFR